MRRALVPWLALGLAACHAAGTAPLSLGEDDEVATCDFVPADGLLTESIRCGDTWVSGDQSVRLPLRGSAIDRSSEDGSPGVTGPDIWEADHHDRDSPQKLASLFSIFRRPVDVEFRSVPEGAQVIIGHTRLRTNRAGASYLTEVRSMRMELGSQVCDLRTAAIQPSPTTQGYCALTCDFVTPGEDTARRAPARQFTGPCRAFAAE